MHDVARPETMNTNVKSKRKPVWIAIASVVGVIVLLLLIKGLQISSMISAGKKMAPPPETVTSAVVKEEDWAPTLRAVGSISPVQGAIVSAELAGVVSQVAFENGGVAKKGDLLVQLDASAEEAQLHSAEADKSWRRPTSTARAISSRARYSKRRSMPPNRNSNRRAARSIKCVR